MPSSLEGGHGDIILARCALDLEETADGIDASFPGAFSTALIPVLVPVVRREGLSASVLEAAAVANSGGRKAIPPEADLIRTGGTPRRLSGRPRTQRDRGVLLGLVLVRAGSGETMQSCRGRWWRFLGRWDRRCCSGCCCCCTRGRRLVWVLVVVVATLPIPEAARLAAAGAAATLVDAAAAVTPIAKGIGAVAANVPVPAPVAPAPAAGQSLNLPLVPEDDTRSRPRSNLPAALALALAEEPPSARGPSSSVLLLRFLTLLPLLDIDVPFDFFILLLDNPTSIFCSSAIWGRYVCASTTKQQTAEDRSVRHLLPSFLMCNVSLL